MLSFTTVTGSPISLIHHVTRSMVETPCLNQSFMDHKMCPTHVNITLRLLASSPVDVRLLTPEHHQDSKKTTSFSQKEIYLPRTLSLCVAQVTHENYSLARAAVEQDWNALSQFTRNGLGRKSLAFVREMNGFHDVQQLLTSPTLNFLMYSNSLSRLEDAPSHEFISAETMTGLSTVVHTGYHIDPLR